MLPPKAFLSSPLKAPRYNIHSSSASSNESSELISTCSSSVIPPRLINSVRIRTDYLPLDLSTNSRKNFCRQGMPRRNLDRSRLGSSGEGVQRSPLEIKAERLARSALGVKRLTWVRRRLLTKSCSRGAVDVKKSCSNKGAEKSCNFSKWRPWQENELINATGCSSDSAFLNAEKNNNTSTSNSMTNPSSSVNLKSVCNQNNPMSEYLHNSSSTKESNHRLFCHHPINSATSRLRIVTSPAQDCVTPSHDYLPIPFDPRQWTRLDVANWLLHMRDLYNIPHLDLQRFHMNGKALCLMKPEMFLSRVPSHGRILHQDFQLRIVKSFSSQLPV